MRTRRAALADLNRLLDLERVFPTDRLSRPNLRRLLRRGHADVWVCEERGTVHGDIAVLYRRGSLRARIYSLAVDPAARGRGMARALLALAENGARARGKRIMGLEVRCDNAAALGLYERSGYRITARLAHFYEDRAAALKMEKPLVPAQGVAARPAGEKESIIRPLQGGNTLVERGMRHEQPL